jgi:hypothetical protein
MTTKRKAKARSNGHGPDASLDVEIQETPIVIGGRRRTMRLDTNATVALEQAGITLDPSDAATIGNVTALLWALLVHEEPSLTVKEVRSWISGRNIDRVIEVVGKAADVAKLPKADG